MKVQVAERFRNLDSVRYMQEFMRNFCNDDLDVFAIKEGKAKGVVDGVWGNCKYPDFWRLRRFSKIERKERKLKGFRVSCFLKGNNFPRPPRRDMKYKGGIPSHAGSTRIEYYAQDANEALLWLMAHEYAHYLALSGYGNFNNSEKNMDMIAYDILHAYRQGIPAQEIAVKYSSMDRRENLKRQLTYLPSNYPYLRR